MRDLVATCRGEWPKTSICPFVGYSNPSISFTVVDLPEPLGPSRPNTSPRRTSKSTPSTARALGRPQKSLNTFVRPRTDTTTSPSERRVVPFVIVFMQLASAGGPRTSPLAQTPIFDPLISPATRSPTENVKQLFHA